VFAGLLLQFSSGFAQEKLEHTKTHYTSPEGKLYWNMDLPVYLSLSASPEGQRQPLLYDGEENLPFYFTVEGLNYIKTPWAIDKETKKQAVPRQTVNFPIYADGSPPVVSHQFSKAKAFKNNSYLGIGANFSISASDRYSGTANIFISIDSSEFSVYTDTLSFDISGKKTVAYYAVDYVGNSSIIKVVDFTLDYSAPNTELLVENSPMADESIFSGQTLVLLKANDNYSNVKRTFYKISDGSFKTYFGPLRFDNLESGDYTIVYYSEDYVGNKEEEKSFSFYLDKSPPMVVSRIIGDIYKIEGKTFFSGKTQLKFTGIDNKAGVKKVRYSVDGGEYQDYQDKSVYLSTEPGKHSISYYAIDSTGNDSRDAKRPNQYAYELENYYIDLTGPEISYEIKGERLQADSVLFLSPETKIYLKTYDRESGSKSAAYCYNDEVKEREYDEEIILKDLEHGKNRIDFFAYDNVNNRNIDDLEFFLDRKGPEILLHFGSEQIGITEGISAYPSFTTLFVAASDKDTGIKSISYSINGSDLKPYTGMIRGFKTNARNTIEIVVHDLLGNSSRKELEIFIK
jgi:hypothetical protein